MNIPTPAVMPSTRTARKVRAVPVMTLHSRCAQGERCTGPGCTVRTGKTAARKG